MDGNNIRPRIIDLHDDELGKISYLYANVALMLSKWHQHDFKFWGYINAYIIQQKNIIL